MSDNQEVKTYDIPEWNLDELKTRIAKLNKRADKLKCSHVELVIRGDKMITDPNEVQKKLKLEDWTILPPDEMEKLPKIKIYTISINGEGPKLAGWKFIGTLDHVSLPGEVIVNTVPGNIVPQDFHNNKPICDHCERIRYRKETFVVESEEGEYKQVGRNCLRDFLGHDPSRLISYLQSLYSLMGDLEDDENGGFYGGSGEWYYNLHNVLNTTACVIRSLGWTPRSAADEKRSSTSSYVWTLLNPPTDKESKKAYNKLREQVGDVTDEDIEETTNALEWLKEQEDNNEYMHNIKAIARATEFSGRLMGYACSIVAAYQRARERLRLTEEKLKSKLNEYIKGDIKDRLDMIVTVEKRTLFDGAFGTVRIFRMVDEKGRTVVWFANSDPEMEEGGTYKIKGTIKKFDEYKEWKQTVLTRVKVLEELKAPKEEAA